jgi:hypothetical protein
MGMKSSYHHAPNAFAMPRRAVFSLLPAPCVATHTGGDEDVRKYPTAHKRDKEEARFQAEYRPATLSVAFGRAICLEHRAKKWMPVFGKSDATKNYSRKSFAGV